MNGTDLKPRQRSAVRIRCGRLYFTWKRYMKWYLGRTKFAKTKDADPYPYQVFQHQTPLYRQLRNVDMWLQENKVVNLQLAVKRLNRLILRPGETFSYWYTIGKPTRRKGYKPGMVLYYGQFKAGTGGGLCQLSNLIYWMTLHTPLQVKERHRHSYDVFPDANRTQPFGSGATCAYNYLDLQIYNASQEPYQLLLHLTDTHLVGEWRSVSEPLYHYEIIEQNHSITQQYWGGYVRHNDIYRLIYNSDDELLDTEWVTSNDALMSYSPLLKE